MSPIYTLKYTNTKVQQHERSSRACEATVTFEDRTRKNTINKDELA